MPAAPTLSWLGLTALTWDDAHNLIAWSDTDATRPSGQQTTSGSATYDDANRKTSETVNYPNPSRPALQPRVTAINTARPAKRPGSPGPTARRSTMATAPMASWKRHHSRRGHSQRQPIQMDGAGLGHPARRLGAEQNLRRLAEPGRTQGKKPRPADAAGPGQQLRQTPGTDLTQRAPTPVEA